MYSIIDWFRYSHNSAVIQTFHLQELFWIWFLWHCWLCVTSRGAVQNILRDGVKNCVKPPRTTCSGWCCGCSLQDPVVVALQIHPLSSLHTPYFHLLAQSPCCSYGFSLPPAPRVSPPLSLPPSVLANNTRCLVLPHPQLWNQGFV